MRSNKFLYLFVTLLAGYWLTLSAYAAAVEDPVTILKSVARSMIDGLKSNQATLKTKPTVVYQLANKYIVPHADLTAMSKYVLSPQIWNSATPEQRQQFQNEFTKTLIRTYASALSSYSGQTVHFYPVRGGYEGVKTLEITSEIVSDDHDPIRVGYRVMRSGNSWKLYDLSVEGVSMLESFRAQFSDLLAQGNMNQLLNRMSNHNQGMKG